MEIGKIAAILACAEQMCNERGLRLAEQRMAVLRLLCEADRPLSAYELLDRMRNVMKNPAPPTVYRALDFLLEQGLAHKLESLHAFVGCTHPDHHHAGQFFICTDCGEVSEVEDQEVVKTLAAAERAAGFRSRRSVVELLGTCAQCSVRGQE